MKRRQRKIFTMVISFILVVIFVTMAYFVYKKIMDKQKDMIENTEESVQLNSGNKFESELNGLNDIEKSNKILSREIEDLEGQTEDEVKSNEEILDREIIPEKAVIDDEAPADRVEIKETGDIEILDRQIIK